MTGLIERKGVQGSGLRVRGKSVRPQPPTPNPEPITANFKHDGDAIILFGDTKEELGGSEYLAVIYGRKAGRPPRIDLVREHVLQQVLVEAASQGWLASAHDCSDGGLAVALAESCIMDREHLIGATISFEVQGSRFKGNTPNPEPRTPNIRVDALLFGESAGRIVVSCARRFVEPLAALAATHGVPTAVIGRVGGPRLTIGSWIDAPVDELSDAWRSGMENSLRVQG
jgi:phosphoribosylformylglycinamidine synthase